jgi:hypothetical protein
LKAWIFTTALVVGAAGLNAQEPSLDTVLANASAYVGDFHLQLSQIVAEETYLQSIKHQQSAFGNPVMLPERRLRSDRLLVRPEGADRYVEFRDVFQVNGEPVRDREERLTRLLRDSSSRSIDQMAAIIKESARYNIGSIERNINTPVLAMLFLSREYQPRFRFKRSNKRDATLGKDPGNTDEGASPVFRVATAMWTIEFQERRKGTVIKTPNGRDLPAKGRFWINPETGAVLMTELVIEAEAVKATVTVSYQSEPLMGFLVPVEMRESYVARGERIEGAAVYGRFQSASVLTAGAASPNLRAMSGRRILSFSYATLKPFFAWAPRTFWLSHMKCITDPSGVPRVASTTESMTAR